MATGNMSDSIEALATASCLAARAYPMGLPIQGARRRIDDRASAGREGAVVDYRARALSHEGGKGRPAKWCSSSSGPIRWRGEHSMPSCPGRSHNLTVSEALRVPGERSETRDPGQNSRTPQSSPLDPGSAPAGRRFAGTRVTYSGSVTDQLQRVSCARAATASGTRRPRLSRLLAIAMSPGPRFPHG